MAEADLRPLYNNDVSNVLRTIQTTGGLDYENAVADLVAKYGGSISPQEIGDTLYGIYSDVLGAPRARYYGINPTTGGGGYGSSSGTTAPRIDPATIAALDQQIGQVNAGIGRLDSTLNSGYSEIDASYQNALNQLLGAKNQAETGYKTNKQTSATGYVAGKNTVGTNAGNSLNGLLRLLGSQGAGGSSAYRQTAPEAVTRQATIQRTDLGNTFGANEKALDTNWGNYMTGYENQVSSAGSQREQGRRGLENQINTNRANLLNQLASLVTQRSQAAGGTGISSVAAAQPFLNQANQFLDAASRYQVAPITYKTEAYQAPNLDKYTTNPNAVPTVQGQGPQSDYFSPYLGALLDKKKNNTAAIG